MKITRTLLLGMSLSALSLSLQAGVQQFGLGSHAEPDRACELQSHDNSESFTGTSRAIKGKSSCTVSIPRLVFEQRFEYCALSGIRETKDDRFTWEHDYGSQCSFEFNRENVLFEAVRGFGFSEGSTSMLYCQFTCIEATSSGQPGLDLDVVTSTPLAD